MTRPGSHVSLLTMIASPILWVLLFAASYALTGLSCSAPQGSWLGSADTVRNALLAAAAAAGVLILCLGTREELRRRAAIARQQGTWSDEEHAQVPMFLHHIGVLLSAASLLGTLWLVMNMLISPLCGA